jgi:diguanylate cyclase (GGDEF)-like protein
VSYPVQVDDQLLMVVDQKFFAWDGKRFAPSDAGGLTQLITRPEELALRTAPDGTRYAFTSRELLARKPGERNWKPLQVDSPLARGFTQLSVESDGSVSLIGWNALLSFDPSVEVPAPDPLKTRLFRVRVHYADNSTQLLDRRGAELTVAPHRSLEVEFGVDSAETGIEFRSELEGLDGGYGEWSKLPRREFAGLAPGAYTLRVEARTGSGRLAEPLAWSFKIEPRWYQTLWARSALAMILLALGLGLARHYAVRRLRLVEARNRKLEELISERTTELARANRQLARLATLDGLTAIPNRRAFDNFIEHALSRCRERNEPLSLLMLDVDHFKRYNDRHGHLAGDDMLRTIAADLARFAREEFALVMAGAALTDAQRRAEEICAHFRERAGSDGLTISIGVATRVPKAGDTSRALIDAADHALYDAKHKGRARVELAA